MEQIEYWEEAVSETMADRGIAVSDKDITAIAKDMLIAHHQNTMAFPLPQTSSLLEKEIEKLGFAIKREQSKMVCGDCGGKGYIRLVGIHISTSDCDTCNGTGFIYLD